MSDEDFSVPDYPRLEPEARVRMHRGWEASAWVGTADRLIRIQGLLQDSLERAYSDAVAALPEMDPRDRKHQVASLGRQLGLEVEVAGARGRMIRSGELSAIVSEMDASEIEQVKMSVKAYSDELPALRLRFERNPDYRPALEFSVSGPDRQWVGGLNDALQTELRKGVPWWSVLRRTPAAVVLTLVPTVGILVGLVLSVETGNRSTAAAALFALAPLIVMLATFPLTRVLKWLFPGFEVLEPGAVARGRQVLAASVTTVSFAIGVIGLVVSL